MQTEPNLLFPVIVTRSFLEDEDKVATALTSTIKDYETHPQGKGMEWAKNCESWNSLGISKNILKSKRYSHLTHDIIKASNQHAFAAGCREDQAVYITESWTNVTGPGDYQEYHTHGNHHFSGVLYLSVPEDSGSIVFQTPHNTMFLPEFKDEVQFEEVKHNPVVGEIIIFPSYLNHQVLRNKSDKPRVSLAFNYIVVGTEEEEADEPIE